MKTLLATGWIPELRPLTKGQQKAVYQCATEALFAEQPATLWGCNLWVFGGIAAGALAGGLAAAGGMGWNWSLPCLITGGLTGAVVGNLLGTHWIHGKLRPYFRRVLEERKAEIEQIR